MLACVLALWSQPWSTGVLRLMPLIEGPQQNLAARDTNSKALLEMLGGTDGPRVRWARAPHLKVLVSVMEYTPGNNAEYIATGEQLSEKEIDDLVADLTAGLGLFTADTFAAFAGVERQALAPGATAPVSHPNTIVVGRFHGVQKALGTIGLGGRDARADGTIRSGAVLLDSDYDRTSPKRRLLRTHELGHALGYNHVQSRESIMNPRIGSEPNSFDREAVLVAFRPTASTTSAR